MKSLLLAALALCLWTAHARAQEADASNAQAAEADDAAVPSPPADAATRLAPPAHATPGSAYDVSLESAVALRLELASINSQQSTANALYVTSAILGVIGTGLMAAGIIVSIATLTSSTDNTGPTAMIYSGIGLNIVHVVFMIVGACLDYGSGSHRRKLLAAHPELAFSLAPGPGDAGLGLTLHF